MQTKKELSPRGQKVVKNAPTWIALSPVFFIAGLIIWKFMHFALTAVA
jgi:hypothetical protein